MGGIVLATFAAVVGTCVILFSGHQEQALSPPDIPAVHEITAWVAFLLAPVEAFILGRLITGVFVQRYAITTIIGFSILLPLCLRRLYRNSKGAALATLFFLGLCFGTRYAVGLTMQDLLYPKGLEPWLRASADPQSPIVVADPLTYLDLAYNANRDVSDVLVYLPDPQEALRYTGENTADYGLAGLRGITPLNLPTYPDFLSSHQQFFFLWEYSRRDWIVRKLRDTGAEFRFCNALGPHVLFLVDFPRIEIPTQERESNVSANVTCKKKH